jgi:O-antigen/teichoic acid export membrane protein
LIKINQRHNDLYFTLLNQLWRLISGLLIMLLIPLFLYPEQQGYWYLFGSLAALSIFADLGFSNIILQFSAHEFACLHFIDTGLLSGEKINLQKLGSFFRFVIKWILTICAVVFPIIYVIGILFFTRDNVLSIYLLPWTLYAFGTLINFLNNSILSFIEGLNKIAVIQKIRFVVAIINTTVVVMLLVLGGNIYALAFGMLLSGSSMFISIFGTFKRILLQLLDVSKGFVHSWGKEVVRLFIRYAISWSSGYFIFQIYTPLMHYFHGPIYGGKVGITLALMTGVLTTSNIWMYTITPEMNILISQKLWDNLDSLFRKRLLLSAWTYLVITVGLFLFLALFGNFWIIPKITARFLPITSLIILFVCYFLNLVVNSWALYLRGHKREPYMIPSVVTAILTATTTYLVGIFMSPAWFFFGFLTGCVWATVSGYIIYRKCKRKWHTKIK